MRTASELSLQLTYGYAPHNRSYRMLCSPLVSPYPVPTIGKEAKTVSAPETVGVDN